MNRVLYEGKIETDRFSFSYRIEPLQHEHKNELLALQEEVVALLADPELYFPLTVSELDRIFQGAGDVYGLRGEGKLLGFSVVLYPSESENLASDIGLEREKWSRCVHLEATLVHPFIRGFGIQKTFYRLIIQDLLRRLPSNDKRYALSTVSPKNIPSIASTLSSGVYIAFVKKKYNDQWRYIFYQDLKNPLRLMKEETALVKLNDLATQAKRFEEGYYGYALQSIDHTLYLRLAKEKQYDL